MMYRVCHKAFSKTKLLGLFLLSVTAAALAAGCSFSGKEVAASPNTPVLKLDPIVVNLAGSGRYVRVFTKFD